MGVAFVPASNPRSRASSTNARGVRPVFSSMVSHPRRRATSRRRKSSIAWRRRISLACGAISASVPIARGGAARAALERLADAPDRAWALVADSALDPFWPQLERLLHADIGSRVRRLGEGGLAAMFGALHEAVEWRAGAVRVRLRLHEEIVDCAGRGLVLAPSVFGRSCAVITEAPAQPTLYYPALGVSERWHHPAGEHERALAGLLGAGRAAAFLALREPLSTSELAARCGLSPATASHHVGALRAAGLVASRREGRRMVHTRTPLGDGLAAG